MFVCISSGEAYYALDPNMCSYFDALGIMREFKYDGDFNLWWKPKKDRMDGDLRELTINREALELDNY